MTSNKKTLNTGDLTTINPIPGAESLGYGFNIFGRYDINARITSLFDLEVDDSRKWEYKPTSTTFLVPKNVSTPANPSYAGSSYAFDNAREFTQHFQAKAKVSGSVGAFKGQFSASYSSDERDVSKFSYGLYEYESTAWSINLRDYSESKFLEKVTSSQTFKDLPDKFSSEDAQKFFAFFQKFGTHFIETVYVGGNLYYYISIASSYQYSRSEITSKASAEWNGLIAKSSAKAEQEWNTAGQEWAERRRSHISAVGADAGVLNWVSPAFGTNDPEAFSNWTTAVQQNPATVGFSLEPIWKAFSGDKANALMKAFAKYADSRITVESSYKQCSIYVNGTPLRPHRRPPSPTDSGIQLAILNRETLEPAFNEYFVPDKRYSVAFFDEAFQAVRQYEGDEDYIVVLATYGLIEYQNPTQEFYEFLQSSGGGGELTEWDNLGPSGTVGRINYVLIGVAGAGTDTGIERLAQYYSDWGPEPHEVVTHADAFLMPLPGEDDTIVYSPTDY